MPRPNGAISSMEELQRLVGKSIYFVTPRHVADLKPVGINVYKLSLEKVLPPAYNYLFIIKTKEVVEGMSACEIGVNHEFGVNWKASDGRSYLFSNFWFALAYGLRL